MPLLLRIVWQPLKVTMFGGIQKKTDWKWCGEFGDVRTFLFRHKWKQFCNILRMRRVKIHNNFREKVLKSHILWYFLYWGRRYFISSRFQICWVSIFIINFLNFEHFISHFKVERHKILVMNCVILYSQKILLVPTLNDMMNFEIWK